MNIRPTNYRRWLRLCCLHFAKSTSQRETLSGKRDNISLIFEKNNI